MFEHKRWRQLGNVIVSLGEDQFSSWDPESGAWKWNETLRCDNGNIVYRKEGALLLITIVYR